LQQQLRRSYAVVSGEDSHDDFKPKYKSQPASDINSTIEKDIKSHEVFIYMKVSKQQMLCCCCCCMPAWLSHVINKSSSPVTLNIALAADMSSAHHEQLWKQQSSCSSSCQLRQSCWHILTVCTSCDQHCPQQLGA
jgi:hypothetical protein